MITEKLKFVVPNFSGNSGKTTFCRQVLLPRLAGAELISVESANADGQEDIILKGKRFTTLMQTLALVDCAIVDVGASNAEDFLWAMGQQFGSQEDFDCFIVPTVPEAKQIRDTLKTVNELILLGVDEARIKVVFNKVERDMDVKDIFAPVFEYQQQQGGFGICTPVMHVNEVYSLLVANELRIADVLADTTDYRAVRKAATDDQTKMDANNRLMLKQLCLGVQTELDAIFDDIYGDLAL